MWFPWMAAALADDCDKEIAVFSTQPAHGQVDVPVDAVAKIQFSGSDVVGNVFAELLDSSGEVVPSSDATWCYEHEGPLDFRCWIRMDPDDDLAPDAEYTLRARATEGDATLWEQGVPFRTGTGEVAAAAGPPTLAFDEVWDVDEAELGPCDYAQLRRYWLLAAAQDTDPTALAVVHLDLVPVEEGPLERWHTVMLFADRPEIDMKQYLDGGKPLSDCFVLSHEDGAGRVTEGEMTCYGAPPGWTLEDTGDTGDTAPADSDSGDSEPTVDSDAADSPVEPGDSDDPTPPAEPTCGCGSAAAALVPLFGLMLFARRWD